MISYFKNKKLISMGLIPYVFSIFLLFIWATCSPVVDWTTWRVFCLISLVVSFIIHYNYLKSNKSTNISIHIMLSMFISTILSFFICLFFFILISIYSFVTWHIPEVFYKNILSGISQLTLIAWWIYSLYELPKKS